MKFQQELLYSTIRIKIGQRITDANHMPETVLKPFLHQHKLNYCKQMARKIYIAQGHFSRVSDVRLEFGKHFEPF